jgi:hypothetical protein
MRSHNGWYVEHPADLISRDEPERTLVGLRMGPVGQAGG